jgi:cysteine sulfinate desulfinase/cysteine desulfurase-like protein
MGYPDELAAGALRCTTGRSTSVDDVDRAAAIITTAVEQIRNRPGAAVGASAS